MTSPGRPTEGSDPTRAPLDPQVRRAIRRQALSVGAAVAPFGVVFGVACAEADLTVAEAIGFSTIVFGGSAQFAAVGVLGDGGGPLSAIVAGLLLNVRSLAFGVLLAPVLTGPRWWRAAASQLVIDESTAVATAQSTPAARRAGFLAGGLSVFVLWNLATIVGVVAADAAGDEFITTSGLDAAAPAAFLALLWPRLVSRDAGPARHARIGRTVALAGAAITLAAVPWAPAGLPILLAATGALVGVSMARRAAEPSDA